MRAVVQAGFGRPSEVLEIRELDLPEPSDDEVLVRVRASSVNPADWFPTVGRPLILRPLFGLTRPRHAVPGKDVAGTVEAVGRSVTRFTVGDEVYGELRSGAFAEYAVAPQGVLAPMPRGLGFAEAAAVPLAGITALQGTRDAGRVGTGQRLLVVGASGGVGTFAVQVAKALGAHVTAVCSARNAELVRAIGADEVIDYASEDFTRGEPSYDVIFDLIGGHPISACRRVLHPDGTYVAAAGRVGGDLMGPIPYVLRVKMSSLRPGPRMKLLAATPNPKDLGVLARFIESGQVSPVIDHTYKLDEIATALDLQGEGHARGKTVVSI
jgi:NADPH:quinone reductase-like Zn-dependent oxidoreductase